MSDLLHALADEAIDHSHDMSTTSRLGTDKRMRQSQLINESFRVAQIAAASKEAWGEDLLEN